MLVLTENRRCKSPKGCGWVPGNRVTLLHERADSQPARTFQGSLLLCELQPCIRRGLTGRNTGQPLLWARPERAERVAKAAPEVERLPGMRGSVTENALKASPINFGLAEYRSPSWKCLKP